MYLEVNMADFLELPILYWFWLQVLTLNFLPVWGCMLFMAYFVFALRGME